MGSLIALCLCLCVALPAVAALDEQPVILPAWEAIPKIDNYASREEYEAAAGDRKYTLTRVSYPSGDLTVFAYLYAPAAKPKTVLPVVVFNRGSFTWKQFACEYLAMFHRLAVAGFVVVAPMVRGSGGAPGRDEMGGADLDDLMNTPALLRQLPFVDPDHVFMYGESRGGMMTYQAIRERYPMCAAAVYGAFTDLGALTASGARFEKMAATERNDWKACHPEARPRIAGGGGVGRAFGAAGAPGLSWSRAALRPPTAGFAGSG